MVGVGISSSAASGADPVAEAQAAEAAGFDFVSVSDHPVGAQPTYETSVLLGWIAARTHRIGVASRVFAVPFRRPALLAKWAESLDRLAAARLILGLGGGYADDEIAALSGRIPSAREKVDGLADAVQIIRGAWSGQPFSHPGRVHATAVLQISPAPARAIPIWVGSYGPRALAVTGRLADGWIPSYGFAPPAAIPAMLDRIRGAAVRAERPADAVQAIYNVSVRVDPRARTDDDAIAGSGADVAEQLRALTELGLAGFNLIPAGGTELPTIGGDVLPALRA